MPNFIAYYLDRLKLLPPPLKLFVAISADFTAVLLAMLAARMLRVPNDIWPPMGTWYQHLSGPIFSILALIAFGFYRTAARGHSMRLETHIAMSQIVAAIMWLLYLKFFGLNGFPRSICGIYPVFAMVFLVISRRLALFLLNPAENGKNKAPKVPVLIYGRGQDMVALADALRQAGQYKPVAFITTDYTLVGRRLSGLRVYDTSTIAEAKSRFGVRQILLSGNYSSGPALRQLFELMVGHGLSTKLVPNVNDLAAGRATLGAIRELQIEDLLGRDVVAPKREIIEAALRGRTILVTGAGGSIGSEIVRQCMKHGPKKIVLVDNGEFALFEIHRELETSQFHNSEIALIPVLADVASADQIANVFNHHRIDTVFHAAAYKHVRMVQENAIAGIHNNVFGTLVVAEAARKSGTGHFVLISTDKAVRPTSIMGATKRVAELVVQALAAQSGHKTLFCMVRFGNVLGSNGSVVPIFKNQIAKGGPVTVTHPDVTRYFMAIPEAAELVLQAAGLAHSGEVMVLNMGEPIRVVKLARALIELAGHTVKTEDEPDGDIEIKYTGLREGEKMYEELEIGNYLSPTSHSRILSSKEFYLPLTKLESELSHISRNLDASETDEAVAKIMRLAWLSDGLSQPEIAQFRVIR